MRSGSLRLGLTLVLAPILLSGCATTQSTGQSRKASDTENAKIPWDEIEQFYFPGQWRMIHNQSYDGYVIMSASIAADRKVNIQRVLERYPDDSRNELARSLARAVVINTSAADSVIPPRAEVDVIFYEKTLPGQPHVALVYAKQIDFSGSPSLANGRYLNTVVD